jgi:hypothetical protein
LRPPKPNSRSRSWAGLSAGPDTVTSTGEGSPLPKALPKALAKALARRRRATPGVEAAKGPMRVPRTEELRTRYPFIRPEESLATRPPPGCSLTVAKIRADRSPP